MLFKRTSWCTFLPLIRLWLSKPSLKRNNKLKLFFELINNEPTNILRLPIFSGLQKLHLTTFSSSIILHLQTFASIPILHLPTFSSLPILHLPTFSSLLILHLTTCSSSIILHLPTFFRSYQYCTCPHFDHTNIVPAHISIIPILYLTTFSSIPILYLTTFSSIPILYLTTLPIVPILYLPIFRSYQYCT